MRAPLPPTHNVRGSSASRVYRPAQAETRFAMPKRYPSAWFPASHLMLCVLVNPGGSGLVLPKSIIHTPARVSSYTNSSELPTSSCVLKNGDCGSDWRVEGAGGVSRGTGCDSLPPYQSFVLLCHTPPHPPAISTLSTHSTNTISSTPSRHIILIRTFTTHPPAISSSSTPPPHTFPPYHPHLAHPPAISSTLTLSMYRPCSTSPHTHLLQLL